MSRRIERLNDQLREEISDLLRRQADIEEVDIRHYNVIYELVEDVEKALKGLHEPVYKDVVEGHAEVRQIFKVGRQGSFAGSYVRDGTITRGALVRVVRAGAPITSTEVVSLRRFKDDVREVQSGYECGIGLANFDVFEEGDILEFYRRERTS